MEINRPRGTQDYFFNEDPSFDIITNLAKMIAGLNGYYEIKTPIFESRELFIRSIGDQSDIVKKEFYEFTDKSDRKMVLRPEQTASIVRAIIENKSVFQSNKFPLKYFYCGPMFRYERPQSGRLRQFHQFGVECIGSNSYCDDVDLLIFAKSIFDSFNLKNYIIKINNLCSSETRSKWIDALKKYFEKFKKDLSADSIERLDTNPYRILDDKVDGKKAFVKKAPKIKEFASDDEIKYFNNITKLLDAVNIKYEIDETLVRGLDYYSNFVFEFESTSELLIGQPTLLGGGRYNDLIHQLNGPSISCVGFAFGIERLIIALNETSLLEDYIKQYVKVDVVIANLDHSTDLIALVLSRLLRLSGISCLTNFNFTKLEKHFKYAEKEHAKFVVILGQSELKEEKIVIKNQETLVQEIILMTDLIDFINKNK